MDRGTIHGVAGGQMNWYGWSRGLILGIIDGITVFCFHFLMFIVLLLGLYTYNILYRCCTPLLPS